MPDWTGKYLVAGAAVYRVERHVGAAVELAILAGSAEVIGRRVRVAESNVLANIHYGHEELRDEAPEIAGAAAQSTLGNAS